MSFELKKHTLNANGMEYNVRSAGLDQDGELVIFLHGFPESSIVWEEVMKKMAANGYRCLAPNQRGYSEGARPEGMENYVYPLLTGDVIGFAEAVGCTGKFHLVGHDWGAAVGWAVNCYYPERVQSYVAMGTPYNPALLWAMEHDEEQYTKSTYLRNFLVPDVPEQTYSANDWGNLRGVWNGFDQKFIDDYMEIFTQPGAFTAALNWYRGTLLLPDQNQVPYGEIKTPTTFIWGNQDQALGRTAAEKTADFCTGEYHFRELDASHWLMQFNEPECSEIIMEHIKNHSLN